MFAEVYGVEANEEQRVLLHKWLCGYVVATNYADMVNKLCALA
jgi:hypothetical protein